jgi:hypothetical protein
MLSEFIEQQRIAAAAGDAGDMEEGDYFKRELYPLLAEVCGNEFSLEEMQVLYNSAIRIVPTGRMGETRLEVCDYLKRKYDEMKLRASRNVIKSRFGYLKKIVESGEAPLPDWGGEF